MTPLAAGPLDGPVAVLLIAACVTWLGIGIVLAARGDRRGYTPDTAETEGTRCD